MHKSLSILGFVLALSAGAALAQTATTEGDAPAETEEPAEPAAPATGAESTGLALGQPEGPQVGQTYVEQQFTDWELRCIRAEDGEDPCQLYQLLTDSEGNAVAEISFFSIPPGQQAAAGATLVTPLETLLTQQVRLTIDGGEVKRYPFSFCTEVGCISRLGFTADELNELKRGATARVIIVPAAAPNQTVDLTMSLSGFTAGFAAAEASGGE